MRVVFVPANLTTPNAPASTGEPRGGFHCEAATGNAICLSGYLKVKTPQKPKQDMEIFYANRLLAVASYLPTCVDREWCLPHITLCKSTNKNQTILFIKTRECNVKT